MWLAIAGLLLVALCLLLVALYREQRRPRPRVLVTFGRDFTRSRDCCVYIAWQLRSDPEPYHYARSIEMTWDWLPVLFYAHCYDISRLWTGRDRQLIAWSWWAMLIVRGPTGAQMWHAR